MALGVERTHITPDLHDLVTPEPDTQHYNPLYSPPTATPGAQPAATHSNEAIHSRRLSSPLFSSFSTSSHDHDPGFSNAPSRDASVAHGRSPRWPFLSVSSRGSDGSPRQSIHDRPATAATSHFHPHAMDAAGAHDAPTQTSYFDASPTSSKPSTLVLNAQKDSDDVEDAYETRRRRTLFRQNTSTSTRVNRLFTMQNLSPSSSRQPSFQQQSDAATYTRSQPRDTPTLPHHLLDRGLLQGRHSDITVKAFGHEYKLHRIILDRAPFFASALSPPWHEASQKEIELRPEDIDSNITQNAFELALKRLYGCALQAEEDEEATALFATGSWLEMQDLIDDSVESIMRKLGPTNLADMIQVVTANYYGKPGERILESAKAMLCRDGADMHIKAWDGVSGDLARDLIGSDGFFVADEWSRWRLAKRLLDRRLKNVAREAGLWTSHSSLAPVEIRNRAVRPKPTIVEEAMSRLSPQSAPWRQWEALYSHPDVRPLLALLDNDIHYVHMHFEQLQAAREQRDLLGVPVLSDHIIQDALWSNLELRQKVLNASDKDLSLGLRHYHIAQTADPQSESNNNHASSQTSQQSTRARKDCALRGYSSAVSSHARRYCIPSVDCNIVIGDDKQPVYTARAADSGRVTQATSQNDSQLESAEDTETATLEGNQTRRAAPAREAFTTYPPFRFAVELPSARMLKHREKVFSHTVFYAGSLWNVYIKKVKSGAKSPHLGVYLHRASLQHQQPQNSPSSTSRSGAVDRRIGALEQRMQLRQRRAGWLAAQHQQGLHPNTQPPSSPGSPFGLPVRSNGPNVSDSDAAGSPVRTDNDNILHPEGAATRFGASSRHLHMLRRPASGTGYSNASSDSDATDQPQVDLESLTFQPRLKVPALSPYVDKRPTIMTYFKIYSPSRGGRMLSVYESVPCDFNFSQSWGWKSATLMVDEEDENDEANELSMSMAETSFVRDDSMVGADMLESGTAEGHSMLGSGEARKESPDKKAGGFRFIVVLGVV